MDLQRLPVQLTRLRRLFHDDAVLKDIERAREAGAEEGYRIGYATCCTQTNTEYLQQIVNDARGKPDKAGLLEGAIKEAEPVVSELKGFKNYLVRRQDIQTGAYKPRMEEFSGALDIYDRLVEEAKGIISRQGGLKDGD